MHMYLPLCGSVQQWLWVYNQKHKSYWMERFFSQCNEKEISTPLRKEIVTLATFECFSQFEPINSLFKLKYLLLLIANICISVNRPLYKYKNCASFACDYIL